MNIRVQNGKAEATDARPLHDDKGNVNGLPLQDGVIGATNEIALSDTLKVLQGDNRGLDTEGIAPDGKGGYWLCDEYGPFLINVDEHGKILAMHGPQAADGEKSITGGLPNILKWRQPNRGFEGITRMPDGRIIAAVQCRARWISTVKVKSRRALHGWLASIRRPEKPRCMVTLSTARLTVKTVMQKLAISWQSTISIFC